MAHTQGGGFIHKPCRNEFLFPEGEGLLQVSVSLLQMQDAQGRLRGALQWRSTICRRGDGCFFGMSLLCVLRTCTGQDLGLVGSVTDLESSLLGCVELAPL